MNDCSEFVFAEWGEQDPKDSGDGSEVCRRANRHNQRAFHGVVEDEFVSVNFQNHTIGKMASD